MTLKIKEKGDIISIIMSRGQIRFIWLYFVLENPYSMHLKNCVCDNCTTYDFQSCDNFKCFYPVVTRSNEKFARSSDMEVEVN